MTYVNLLNTGKKTVATASAKEKEVSTSMTNTNAGICPKCAKSMSFASIQSGEDVFYCESCRVALPKPNKA